jgi:hypothetical protein
MEKLSAGKVARIRRKLQSAVPQEVLVKNCTDSDIMLEEKENLDGSKPSLVIEIKRILGKEKEDEPSRGVL